MLKHPLRSRFRASQKLALDSEGQGKPNPQDKFLVPFILLTLAARPLDHDRDDGNGLGKHGVAFWSHLTDMHWAHVGPSIVASFLTSLVECVEALTVVLQLEAFEVREARSSGSQLRSESFLY
jgi:hypothetical protein